MDWVASGLTILGTWLMAKHRLTAMYVYMASSIVFAVWALSIRSWAVLILQFVLIGLNVRTILVWRKGAK